jgi:hypothetical protein
MAVVSIEPDALRVTFRGIHRFWALRRQLDVPLAHIVGARIDPLLASASPGWRVLGADLPGVVAAGRFVSHGERVFWDVVHTDKAVVVELRDERYARLVLEVDQPQKTVDTVRRSLRERGISGAPRTTAPEFQRSGASRPEGCEARRGLRLSAGDRRPRAQGSVELGALVVA